MTDFDLQQQLIAQRRNQYAGQREFRAPQGQMVGRHFVAPNALQYLAEGLRSFGGMRGQELAEKELTELSGQRQKATAEALRRFGEQAQGRPADELAEGLAGPVRPAMAPDMQGAFASLLEAPDAGLRQAGMQGMIAQATPKPAKWERVELPTPDGGRRVGLMDMNAPDPLQTFREGGTENAALSVAPSGEAYNPRALQPGQVLADPNKPFMVRDGQVVPNQAYQDFRTNVARAGAAKTNVAVNMPDKKLYEGLGSAVSAQIDQGFTQAQSAATTLNNANQIASALEGAIIGPLAQQRVAIARLGEVLGVTGADTRETLANTRNVIQGLARQELAAAGQMKGQGQITENEREILRRAEAGNIQDFTKVEMQTFVNAIRRTARARVAAHNRNLERLQADPQAATIVPFMQVEVPEDIPIGGGGPRRTPTPSAPALPGGFRIVE